MELPLQPPVSNRVPYHPASLPYVPHRGFEPRTSSFLGKRLYQLG